MKTYQTLLLLAAAGLGLAACDDVAEADRIIEGPTETFAVVPDTVTMTVDGEEFTYIDEHRLLIEDFTGWKCVNCPNVANFLTTSITPIYPSVLVSLHMTSNSFSSGHPNNLCCASADSIADWIYGSSIASMMSLPSVTIDNVPYGDSPFVSDDNSLSGLAMMRYSDGNLYYSVPKVGIALNVTSDAADQYSISTLINYPRAANGQYTLRLWLIQDNVISLMQASSTGWVRNYTNHGVLREVINGSYEGQTVTLDGEGKAVAHTRLDITGKGYAAGYCYVVALVTDTDGSEVLNCNKAKLIDN